MDPAVKAAITTIPDDAWTMIEYPDAIRDETTGQWISKAEVAELGFTAFRSRNKAERVTGRLVVRRIPDLNPRQVEQPTLFDTWRHHAFFTTTPAEVMDTVVADNTHRAHAFQSSRSTPTSKQGRSRTCPPGCSLRTAPGSSSP